MFVGRFSLPRLTGVRRIVGVDFNEQRVHLVEMGRKRGFLGKHENQYEVLKAVSADFGPEDSENDRIAKTKEVILSSGIKAKHAASSINSLGLKIVTIDSPSTIEDIREWIEENTETILKLPISLAELVISYEIVRGHGHGVRVRIAFVRNADVEAHLKIVESLGLEPVHVGAGVQDLTHLTTLNLGSPLTTKAVHFGPCGVTIFSLGDGDANLLSLSSVGTSGSWPVDDVLCEDRCLVGDLPPELKSQGYRPFSVGSEYALAVCSAIGTFTRKVSGLDILPESRRQAFELAQYSLLFRRVVLTVGSLMLMLLAVPFLVSHYVTSQIEALDNDKAAFLLSQVDALEEDLSVLEGTMLGDAGILSRTSVARVMHEVAAALPESLWLCNLQIEAETPHAAMVNTEGFSLSNDHISRFLRRLSENPTADQARLIRSGLNQSKGTSKESPTRRATEFEIVAQLQMRARGDVEK